MSLVFIPNNPTSTTAFTAFGDYLETQGFSITFLATGDAALRLEGREYTDFNHTQVDLSGSKARSLARGIAQRCEQAAFVLTDLSPFSQKLLQTLKRKNVRCIVYCEEPNGLFREKPQQVSKVLDLAHSVLFANSVVARTVQPAPAIPQSSLGYHPLALSLRERRVGQSTEKQRYLSQFQLPLTSLYVYLAEDDKQLHSFLEMIASPCCNFNQTVFLIQKDSPKPQDDKFVFSEYTYLPFTVISDLPLEQALSIADGAVYHQSPVATDLVLAGIPTVQIGSDLDPLAKRKLVSSVRCAQDLPTALVSAQLYTPDVVRERLGISSDWQQELTKAFLDEKP